MALPSLPILKVELALEADPLGDDPSFPRNTTTSSSESAYGTGGWIDVSEQVRSINGQRGRTDDLSKVNTGTAEVILENLDRRYDPLNTDGPYYRTPATYRTNLITNPSFENNTTGWVGANAANPTLAITTAQSFVGLDSLAITATANGNGNAVFSNGGARIPVAPGLSYSASAYVRGGTNSRQVDIAVEWFNSGGTSVGFSDGANVTGSTSNWQRVDVSYLVAPSTAATAQVAVRVFSMVNGETYYIDGVLFEQSAAVQPYFDGSMPNGVWSGTAHASTSTISNARVNLIKRPSFEIGGTTGWSVTGSASSLTTSQVRRLYGAESMRFEINSPGTGGARFAAGTFGTTAGVIAGETYTFSAFVIESPPLTPSSALSNAKIAIRWINRTGSFISASESTTVGTKGNEWTRIYVTATAPVGATDYSLELTGIATGTFGSNFYWDGLLLEQSSTLGPYFDGDLVGAQWIGTTKDSFSKVTELATGASLLLPRRQVRISGCYPNDPTKDGLIWDLKSETTHTVNVGIPTDYGLFYDTSEGTAYTDTLPFRPSTISLAGKSDITVIAKVQPGQNNPSSLQSYYEFEDGPFSICGLSRSGGATVFCEIGIDYGVVKVQTGSFIGPPTVYATGTLPLAAQKTKDPIWVKIVLYNDAGGNNKVYYAPDQASPPTEWTNITTSSPTAAPFQYLLDSIVLPQVGTNAAMTYYPVYLQRLQVFSNTTQLEMDLIPQAMVTMFRGFNSGWRQGYGQAGKDNYVTLNCFDAMGLVGAMKMFIDLVTKETLDTNPWGYWKLGEGGGTVIDYTENNNDLSQSAGVLSVAGLAAGLQGNATRVGYEVPGIIQVGLRANMFSGASVPPTTPTAGNVEKMAVSMWINSPAPQTGQSGLLFSQNDTSYRASGGTFAVHVNTSGFVVCDYWNGSSWQEGITGNVRVDDGLTHHIFVIADRNSFALYVDNVKLTASRAAPYARYGGPIGVGGRPNITFDTTIRTNTIGNFKGDIQEVTYWYNDTTNYDTTVDALYKAGYGTIEESTGARVARILNGVDVPGYMVNIDATTYGICGATEYTSDQTVLEAIQVVEDTEQGLFYADRQGRLAFQNRYYLSSIDTGINVQAFFDDQDTNIGYRNLEFTYDADQIVNDHIIADDIGDEYQAQDPASVDVYGKISRKIETLLFNATEARNMAIGLTNIYKTPIMRAEPFEVVPLNEEWMKVLPLDLGMRLNLQATPLGVGQAINQDLALQSISWSATPRNWQVNLIGSPRPVISYFKLGGYSNEITRTNFVTNPSFETNITGYTGSNCTISQSTTAAYVGTNSLQAIISTTGTNRYVERTSRFGVTTNAQYTASAWVYLLSSNVGTTDMRLEMLPWNGSTYGTAYSGTTVTVQRNVWTRISVTFTPTTVGGLPVTEVLFRTVAVTSMPAGDAFYIDALLFEQTPELRPYFDGGAADFWSGYTLISQSWQGVTHASTSIAVFGEIASLTGSELDGPDVLGF